ncbi:Alpha-aminoadipate--LysW ligase LysX [Oceanobacillus picturae]|uniref:Alpha-aminoadipate--LysW ligase LysX n=1 Tax=Oceanobacillus picturae TaxID=171693 RepID=W9A7H8_9BACI|nr:RimK family alpha-L-glutamate ligase [Oceanobacillus picturae]RIU93682.1 RimK family alpha-L-glutamate ligase [Oceanobacillus picturae]CDO01734.1 Alpha-aminoadipate--LysW ligase LysX [Oceanobacillus picturae]
MNLHGWIVYNGSLKGNKFLDFAEWIQEAALKQGSSTTIYKNNELLVSLQTNNIKILSDNSPSLPDYVVFADKDIYLAKQLELLGIPVFNRSSAIEVSDDKIATFQQLSQYNIPLPATIVAPKVFMKDNTHLEDVHIIAKELGFPLIIKEAFGSFGEQVYLIHDEDELHKKVLELQGKPYLYQAFISSSFGKDLRLHVVGDQVVAAMKRQSLNDFRANVSAGGTTQTYTPSVQEEELAIAATKAIGADFAGVDLLIGEDEYPIVCEINSNAHIRSMFDCTGINVADHMVQYVLEVIKDGRIRNSHD